MQDQRLQVKVWPTMAGLAWVATIVLIITAAWVGNLYVAHAGLAMSAAAATLTIRCFICYQTRMIWQAYNLGRTARDGDCGAPLLPLPRKSDHI